jgi:hypothetical protein
MDWFRENMLVLMFGPSFQWEKGTSSWAKEMLTKMAAG